MNVGQRIYSSTRRDLETLYQRLTQRAGELIRIPIPGRDWQPSDGAEAYNQTEEGNRDLYRRLQREISTLLNQIRADRQALAETRPAVDLELEQAPIVCPLGWEAGQKRPFGQVMDAVALEMQSHVADLRALVDREPDPARRAETHERAELLERYSAAYQLVICQAFRTAEIDEAIPQGLRELAVKYRLALPPDLKPKPDPGPPG